MKAFFTHKDAIGPELRERIRQLDGPGREETLEVMGLVVHARTIESFTDESSRVAPWPDKADGTPATLQLTHALRQSYRVVASPRVVEIGSDRPYALRHQLGDATPGMPARPMLPVDAGGELAPEVKRDIVEALGDHLGL
jgi:phage gpG-like protein